MKRAALPEPKRPYKRHNDRPFNITVGTSRHEDEEPLLGGKTKGAVYLRDQHKEKQSFGTFNYGNFPSYYSSVFLFLKKTLLIRALMKANKTNMLEI